MFKDRFEAGTKLAEKLRKYKNKEGVVLAVPRGGVPVGYVIAKQLGIPLEIILTKKIGHPYNKEYAIGSVSLQGRTIEKHADVPTEYIEEETKRIRELLKEKHKMYLGHKKDIDLRNKIVIVVDDGIATGSTILATIDIIKNNNPGKIIIAVPVVPLRTVAKISQAVDEFIYLEAPIDFNGVGQFYDNFEQVSDEEAIRLLKELNSIKAESILK